MRKILPRLFRRGGGGQPPASAKSVPGGGEEGFGDWEGEARDAAAAHGDAFHGLPGEVA